MKFNELPQETQSEIKRTLKAFDECNVIFEYGEYKVSTGIALKKEYAKDHKFIGTYNKNEIYNKEEQIVNYIEEFLSYPIEYKGNKNWSMIKELESLRRERKQAKIKLVNGNAEIESIINIE